jgi:hypothetical protein
MSLEKPLTLVEQNALAKFSRVALVTLITPEEVAHANRPSTGMLLAIGAMGKPMYEGTVPGHVKARRRAANRRARAARKAQR